MKAGPYPYFLAVLALLLSTPSLGQVETDNPMSFFVPSQTNSGDLGGLVGADAICQRLAVAVGAGNRTWRAYLSTYGTNTTEGENARDRIGNGPWYNARGVRIAPNVADLHGDIQRDRNLIYRETALDERGDLVNGRVRPEGTNNEHDILTGSESHGRAVAGDSDRQNYTCNNWTYDGDDGHAIIGHHDRLSASNTSWNSSHATAGCSLASFNSTGGAGRLYCFAGD